MIYIAVLPRNVNWQIFFGGGGGWEKGLFKDQVLIFLFLRLAHCSTILSKFTLSKMNFSQVRTMRSFNLSQGGAKKFNVGGGGLKLIELLD